MSKSAKYAGRILIYSAPAALTQHIEWALKQQLSQLIKLAWVKQPLSPGSWAMEFEYLQHQPMAAKLVMALKDWHYLRAEVREENKYTLDATLFRLTPELGLHQAAVMSNGDVVLNEHQVNAILKNSFTYEKLISNFESALGNAWDIELEPYRIALAGRMSESACRSG